MVSGKPDKHTKEVSVSIIYLPDRQWQMLELSWLHLGYSTRTIAKNALQGFFALNKQYYTEAAARDAKSRGISQQEHYRLMRDGKSLPRIIDVVDYPASPIAWVPNLMCAENKRRYNTIELSVFNYTLLQFAVVLDGGSLPSVVSKCIYAHLGESYELNPTDNSRVGAWARSYYPQIRLNEKEIYTESDS